MGRLNAHAHILAVAAAPIESVWDLLVELNDRAGYGQSPGFHGLGDSIPDSEGRRFCLHPTGEATIEIRGNDLRELLLAGCMYVAREQLDENVMWRRD